MTISGCLSNRLDRDEVRHFVGPDLCSTVCKTSQHETLCRQKLNVESVALRVGDATHAFLVSVSNVVMSPAVY